MPARYLLRDAVVAWLAARFPKWPAIDAALSREGWKLVTLLRLSPLVPWNVLNYALSVTGDVPMVLFRFMTTCRMSMRPVALRHWKPITLGA